MDRGRAIASAAAAWSIPIRAGYEKLFDELPAFEPDNERERTLLGLAARVSRNIVAAIVTRVDELLIATGDTPQTEQKITANLKRFTFRVPAERAGGIANILAAAWRARLDPQLIDLPVMNAAASAMLAEIVWKSIEIDEIEHRLAES